MRRAAAGRNGCCSRPWRCRTCAWRTARPYADARGVSRRPPSVIGPVALVRLPGRLARRGGLSSRPDHRHSRVRAPPPANLVSCMIQYGIVPLPLGAPGNRDRGEAGVDSARRSAPFVAGGIFAPEARRRPCFTGRRPIRSPLALDRFRPAPRAGTTGVGDNRGRIRPQEPRARIRKGA